MSVNQHVKGFLLWNANYQWEKPALPINRFIRTRQIKHTSNRSAFHCKICYVHGQWTVLAYSCSHTQYINLLGCCGHNSLWAVREACREAKQPLLETWTRTAKAAHQGHESWWCRWNHKLTLALSCDLNLIIHSLFILLASSLYRGWLESNAPGIL